jgi:type IV pilus assembly protein PilB
MMVKKRLGDILMEAGLIDQQKLEETIALQKVTRERLGRLLIKQGFVSEEQIMRTLSQQLRLPYLDLSNQAIDKKLILLVPQTLAENYLLVPIREDGKTLTVAMADPLNILAIDELSIRTRLIIEPVISLEDDIKHAIEELYGGSLLAKGESAVESAEDEEEADSSKVEEEIEEGPISQLVNLILSEAVRDRASDIHIEPEESQLRIRYRVDGLLRETAPLQGKYTNPVTSRIKIMSKLDIAERRSPQDGRFHFSSNSHNIDVRVSSFPTIHGENVVLRLLDQSSILLTLEDLGFLPEDFKKFLYLISIPYGFVLVTGPTGSGKTTTLYATLNSINDPKKNVITLEDPVEYRLQGIRQAQINPKAGLTFAAGLRSILRQDPDIVMVGEIRDGETANIAVQAALTGHLVFSTLHTNDAPSTLIRLSEMGIPPFLIATSVEGVLAQRLIRKLCPDCKEPYQATPEDLEDLRLQEAGELVIHRPKGCRSCKNTGYRGRLGIYELLLADPEIKEMILRKASPGVIGETARRTQGMKTLREDGVAKVLKGITSVEELNRVTIRELPKQDSSQAESGFGMQESGTAVNTVRP